MKSKTPIACLSVILPVAALHADIAPDDTLMEVTWFENAVTESKAGWSGYGLVYANEKYTLDVDRAVSFTPAVQTGRAVRQVFDIDMRPVVRLPEVDAGAQTAFVVRATDAGQSVVAWGRSAPDVAASWHELGAPVYGKRLAVEIDYAAGAAAPAAVRYYLTDDTGDTPFGGTLYSANAQTQVTQYDFTGSGTLASLVGTQTAETAAIVDGVKYAAEDVTDELLVTGLARGAVRVFDPSLVPDGCVLGANNELAFTAEDPDAPQDGLLYYFPLEGTVANVGGSRGGRYVSVGGELIWDDGGWMGSPFGAQSLCCASAETKVCNTAGLVPAGSRWTISFWINASREDWAWKDACGFWIGEQVYNFELINGEALQLYGRPGDYLHEDNGWEKPITCGTDWVNVSVVCNATRDGVDVYVNGAYHASLSVANADNLTAFFFGAYGLREPAAPSMVFVDEVSIWGRALDASQLAYLAGHPAQEEILYVKKGWARVTERTHFPEVPGLTPAQAQNLSATGVAPLRLAAWAIAHDIPYGTDIDVAAFAMNCAPSDKASEAAKLRLTIAMDGESPVVGIVTDADGESVTKDWNIQPTIKGKVRLSDETWGDRTAEGTRFFKAFLGL